jgi:L-glyceraldehyde 3-phosphate reductase
LKQVRALNELAASRGQSLAQMALAWLLKDQRVTSVLVGASKPEQLADSLKCMDNLAFSTEELTKIEGILG